ncbi:MAG TPA: SBBP repeat-containing protein [Candidatus Cloacimonadota bacterium]|nr:SBBP repeat-containing protein [Candidatus Cloacimonadota bacterium]HPS38301.1 SBBP repeat-containing protein [Candidatus Cloacimonadota bacterium]
MIGVRGLALCLALVILTAGVAAQTPEWQWAVKAGGASVDYGESIAVDGAGNQYVTGSYQGTASFGPHTLSSNGSRDLFAAKLDPAGNWLWATGAGGEFNDVGSAIDLDTSGNIYLTGMIEGSAVFGALTLHSSGLNDVFAAKLDPAGNWLWAVRAGGTWYDNGNDLALDDFGNAYLTGQFEDSATFGAITLTSASSGESDIFAAKLDPEGNWFWAIRAGGTDSDSGRGIAIDESGNAWLTGHFMGSAAFGALTLNSSGYEDVFAAKLDSNGNWLWAVRAGGVYWDYGNGIALDDSGNAYLTGQFAGSASFGANTLSSNGQDEIFAAKLGPDGNWLWAAGAGGMYYDIGRDIAIDGEGNSYLTGYFYSSAAFGALTLNASGSREIFAASLDPDGNWLWAVQAGGVNYDSGVGIAVDGAGNTWLTGWFFHYGDFGAITLNASGSEDIYVAKLGSGSPVDDPQTPPAPPITLSVYPNPLYGWETATFKADLAEGECGTLRIVNLRGQCVARHQLSSGENHISLDSRELAAGIYLCELKTRNAWISKKLVLLK